MKEEFIIVLVIEVENFNFIIIIFEKKYFWYYSLLFLLSYLLESICN